MSQSTNGGTRPSLSPLACQAAPSNTTYHPAPDLVHALTTIVAHSDELMQALRLVRTLGLEHWCVGAGAVRSLAWDALHGTKQRSALDDIDLVYFDASAAEEQDFLLEARLGLAMPGRQWEVTNQAHVHRWFASALGQVVPALRSLEEGVATWPEYATCVGVYLNDDDSIGLIAPHGLDDLFALRVRHNPIRASLETYRQRVSSKGFAQRWPRLTISGT